MEYKAPEKTERKADRFAGKGSYADAFRKKRERTESMADIDAQIDGTDTEVAVKRGYMREEE